MSSNNHQFRLSLPAGWSDQSIFVYSGPESHGIKHMLRLVIDPAVATGETLESFARQRIQLTTASPMGMVETLKNEVKTLPSGVRAWEWVYKSVAADESITFNQFTYLILNGRGYTFSCIYTKMSWKLLAGQVEGIISTLLA